LPIEKDPFSRAVLGGLAAATGTSFFKLKGFEGFDIGKNPEELHAMIKGAFEAQPTIAMSLADLLPDNAWEKYPIIQMPRIRKSLEKPYDIDLETVEKFMSIVASEAEEPVPGQPR
jgi:hypothetical protein